MVTDEVWCYPRLIHKGKPIDIKYWPNYGFVIPSTKIYTQGRSDLLINQLPEQYRKLAQDFVYCVKDG